MLAPAISRAETPKPAPPRYATHNYEVTFRTPPGSTYCPLPPDWVGSDHGTTLFLEPPHDCGGAGYPSSDRGFGPAGTPRIEVYYGYLADPGDDPTPPCRHRLGKARLFGELSSLCLGARDGMTTADVRGRYEADGPAEFELTLLTTRSRLAADLRTLEALAASVRPCAAPWADTPRRRACPAGVTWF